MVDVKKLLSVYAPLLPAILIAGTVAAGLSGYQTQTYAISDPAEEESVFEESSVKKEEEKFPEESEASAKEPLGSFDAADGTYQGSGSGFNGKVTVSVTIGDQTIRAIDLISHSDTSSFFSRAWSQVTADILSGQTLDVDVVSGATYSSKGILQAVRNAMHTAAGEETEALYETIGGSSENGGAGAAPIAPAAEPSSYKDGTYTGSGNGFNGGRTTVSVTVSGGRIAAINVLSHGDTTSYFLQARDRIISAILAGQTTNVDTVSGATFSSNGLISAVRAALSGAAGTNGAEGTPFLPAEADASKTEANTPKTEAVDESGAVYKDGTYTGKAEGFNGELEVSLVIEDGKIKVIKIISSEDTEEYLRKAEKLTETIIREQTTNVDVVSGATFSSRGIINAVRDALTGALVSDGSSANKEAEEENDTPADSRKEEEDALSGRFDYEDGIYIGSADGFNDEIIIGVTICDKTIAAVTVLYQDDTPTYFRRAGELLRRIVETQNTDLDTVSGATFSSNGILEAVKEALSYAEEGIGLLDLYEKIEEPGPDKDEEGSGKSSVSDNDPSEESGKSSVSDNDPSEESGKSSVSDNDPSEESGKPSVPDDDPSGGTEDTSLYKDGEYNGTALCVPDEDEAFVPYNLTLTIRVLEDRVVGISDIAGDGAKSNNSFIRKASEGMTDTILNAGLPDAVDLEKDAVSGATCTSKAILDAAANALDAAGK